MQISDDAMTLIALYEVAEGFVGTVPELKGFGVEWFATLEPEAKQIVEAYVKARQEVRAGLVAMIKLRYNVEV